MQKSIFFKYSIVLFIEFTIAKSICSKAPAEALIEPGEIFADSLDGTIIPCTPKISAVLAIAPKLCGSCILSRKTRNGGSFLLSAKKIISSTED